MAISSVASELARHCRSVWPLSDVRIRPAGIAQTQKKERNPLALWLEKTGALRPAGHGIVWLGKPHRNHAVIGRCTVKRSASAISMALATAVLAIAPAVAEPPQRLPFTQSLSNTTPLVFGMNAVEAATALGVPLDYVSGLPGNEVLAAKRPSRGYFPRHARLFLQFRAGRLSGWKGDWERNWMWE
jgi:hypothetical protein